MREKLIELLETVPHPQRLYPDLFVDMLIANGCRLEQKQATSNPSEQFASDNNVGRKCDYCQEDAHGFKRMFGAFVLSNPFHGREWLIETGHCKPRNIYFCPMCGRKLAEPPKGE